MVERRNVFLDYGDLITNCDFNRKTLGRANRLVTRHLNPSNCKVFSLEDIELAHDKAIESYLQARSKGNREWHMSRIVKLMLSHLGFNENAPVQELEDLYKLNDHNSKAYLEAYEVLPELAKTRTLGIISNSPHDSLIHELRRDGLYDLFETITYSGEIGVRKPHPKIYQEAMRRARTTPENSVFISHDLEEVRGAEQVGMRGILVKSLKEVMGVL